jgi:pimeloyl-ACP methyl ester carboxylesterase
VDRASRQHRLTEITDVDSLALRTVVPCGAGSMVWRRWGDGRPLVLLHGASGSWTHWIRNIPALAREQRVFAADMPGYGDSDAPPEPHTADGLADLVAAGIDAVIPPPAAFDLAGFSFGGIIGGLVAARLGRRVGRLVVLGIGGLGLGTAPMRPLRRITPDMSEAEIRHVHRENLNIVMIADPGRIDDLAVSLQIENLGRSRFKSGGIPVSDVLLHALPRIEARIGGIWAERDAFVADQIGAREQLLRSFQPDLDFRVIPNAGHWVTYEAPEAVNAALLEMLVRPG